MPLRRRLPRGKRKQQPARQLRGYRRQRWIWAPPTSSASGEVATSCHALRPWSLPGETATGGRLAFTGTRDLTPLLTTRVEGGNPPNIAIPPEVGTLRRFARAGELVPLSACGLEEEVRANCPEGFINLGTVDGTLYAFFMKADTKGTIFYNPKFFAANGYQPLTVDNTFDDLIALTDQIRGDGFTPWSIGVGERWRQRLARHRLGPADHSR